MLRYLPYFVLLIAIITYVRGTICDVFDVDPAQYAAIAMEMLQKHDFLHVTERGLDYLDKPPFLFWISALSYKIFGFNSFAFKLPSLLFSLAGLLSTYKLGSHLYSRKVGSLASVILGTTIGFFWINTDVKTDAILMTCIVTGTYYLVLFAGSAKLINLLFGSIWIGLAMLTKGPMGFVFPVATIGCHLILKKQWSKIFRWQWLLTIPIILLLLAPMCIGLYQQFDMHPEKIVHGEGHVSGLRFYFWDQSFGRIAGTNPMKNHMSFLFLFHSALFLFLPYSLLMIIAYFNRLRNILFGRYCGEYYTFGGSLLILLALSMSSYKIPHYAMIVFPFVAIVVASEISELHETLTKKFYPIHNIALLVISLGACLLSLISFQFTVFTLVVSMLLLFSLVVAIKTNQYIFSIVITGILFGFILNSQLIPNLQKFLPGKKFARLIVQNEIDREQVFFFNRDSRALEFYLNKRIDVVNWDTLLQMQKQGQQHWYFMGLDGKEALLNAGLTVEDELVLMHYCPDRVKLGFFNPKTRRSNIEPRYLVKFRQGK